MAARAPQYFIFALRGRETPAVSPAQFNLQPLVVKSREQGGRARLTSRAQRCPLAWAVFNIKHIIDFGRTRNVRQSACSLLVLHSIGVAWVPWGPPGFVVKTTKPNRTRKETCWAPRAGAPLSSLRLSRSEGSKARPGGTRQRETRNVDSSEEPRSPATSEMLRATGHARIGIVTRIANGLGCWLQQMLPGVPRLCC